MSSCAFVAYRECRSDWPFFKKLFAHFLLDAGHTNGAKDKLDELAELVPSDGDVALLRRMS
jgi:hypothetical protein